MEFLVAIVLFIVLAYAWAYWSANYSMSIQSYLDPEEAREVATSCFAARMNTIAASGGSAAVTPRLKRHAPTLHFDATSNASGCMVEMGADFVVQRYGISPPVPLHGTWVWRKQRKIAKALTQQAPSILQQHPSRNEGVDLELIADFGRHQFLGQEMSGLPEGQDWYLKIEQWREPLQAGDQTMNHTIDELNDLGSRHGGWCAIGAWKLLLEFAPRGTAAQQGAPALVACVRAYEEFGITNLSIHLPRCEADAYREIFGREASTDGFWGPPVFTTSDGPQKADILQLAAQAASSRRPRRLANAPGVEPGGIEGAGLWDFGRLVILGPVVPLDLRDEATLLETAVEASEGTDHSMVLAALRRSVENDNEPRWKAVGAARFCEEYLDASLTCSTGHLYLMDISLEFLKSQGLLDGNISLDCLSPAERSRFGERGPQDTETGGSLIPADWYPDPTNRHELRYWNGVAWSEHVCDAGDQSRDPATP